MNFKYENIGNVNSSQTSKLNVYVSESTSNTLVNFGIKSSTPTIISTHITPVQLSLFNSGNFTVALHKNYGDNLDLTPFTLEIIYLEPEPIVIEQEPIVEETFTPENPPENTCGFTGWQQEGNRNLDVLNRQK